MKMSSKNLLLSSFVFCSVASMVLNPYFVFAKPGQFLAFSLAIYSVSRGMSLLLWRNVLKSLLMLFFLSLVGLISSIFHGIEQFNHVSVALSLIVLALASHGLWLICQRCGVSIDRLMLMILMVVLINSLIIVLELNFDVLRATIEMYLDPIDAGSINYAEGYRLRGIASSGGANLSLLIPAATTIALYLSKKKVIGMWFLTISIALLAFSATVIGRTGLILMPVPFLFFLFFELKKINLQRVFSIFGFLVLAALFLQYFSSIGREFLSDKFGEGFLFYSFEFLFEGKSGLEQEGTAGIIAGFLQVLPTGLAEIFFGYGFYGGGYFEPWTDSGFSRMFLSIGYVFGLTFYFLVFSLYFSIKSFDKFLIFSFVAILSFGELKEPLLFSGFVSRVFMMILVFVTMGKLHSETTSRHYKPR